MWWKKTFSLNTDAEMIQFTCNTVSPPAGAPTDRYLSPDKDEKHSQASAWMQTDMFDVFCFLYVTAQRILFSNYI